MSLSEHLHGEPKKTDFFSVGRLVPKRRKGIEEIGLDVVFARDTGDHLDVGGIDADCLQGQPAPMPIQDEMVFVDLDGYS